MSSDFWAGYLSGALGIIIGNPLDVIKVRLQAGHSRDASAQSQLSRFEKASSLVRGLCDFHISFLSFYYKLLNICVNCGNRCGCSDFGIWSSQCAALRGLQSVFDGHGQQHYRPH